MNFKLKRNFTPQTKQFVVNYHTKKPAHYEYICKRKLCPFWLKVLCVSQQKMNSYLGKSEYINALLLYVDLVAMLLLCM